jgi:imidazoleglycerol-phosphate dehydratase
MRKAEVVRKTAETSVAVKIDLDGKGHAKVSTGIGFLNHMLELTARHGLLDIEVNASGDTDVDFHHTVEDIGIVLGMALSQALGDRCGISRYATVFTPMDESLSMVSLDAGGRAYLHYDVSFTGQRVGDFDIELIEEFLRALAFNGGLTLHVMLLHGRNNHHIIESIFKGLGRALGNASTIDPRIDGVMSTKGLL